MTTDVLSGVDSPGQPAYPPAIVPETPDFLTVKQVSERLQVAERTVWRLIERRELTVRYVGRAARIPVESYEAYRRGDVRPPAPASESPGTPPAAADE